MDRHPPFDLGYTQEAATRRHEPFDPAPGTSRARDLTARLHGLKALYDMERDRCFVPIRIAEHAWPTRRPVH